MIATRSNGHLNSSHILRALIRIRADEIIRQAPGAQGEGLLQHRRLLRRTGIDDLPHLDLLHGFQGDLPRGGGREDTTWPHRERQAGRKTEANGEAHEERPIETGMETYT